MTNEIADAIRAEVGRRLVVAYGDLKAAAQGTGIPYKTIYRTFTEEGKDRTKTVTLDFIMQIVAHLRENFDGDDFPTIYAAARREP